VIIISVPGDISCRSVCDVKTSIHT
jgi:hypothetical protein